MAKEISPIIATILLLLITIALAGTTYIFTYGIFEKDSHEVQLCMDLCEIANMEFYHYDNSGCICLEEICSDFFEYNNTLYGIDCEKIKKEIMKYGDWNT